MAKIINGCCTVQIMPDFDHEATNALANIKNAEAAVASVQLMREQLAKMEKSNRRMFVISLLSAIAAILSSIAAIVSTPFFTGLVQYIMH
jgi:hypothetical protein